MKTLEKQLSQADQVDERSQNTPSPAFVSKYEAFLGMLNKILSSENIEQKSRLLLVNVIGMVQAQVYQVAVKRGVIFQKIDPDTDRFISPLSYLKAHGYVTEEELKNTAREGLSSIQALCKELIVRVISIDGAGRGEMIEMVRAMNLMIQEHEHQDSMAKDILLGARGQNR